jgi:hypothetical protein
MFLWVFFGEKQQTLPAKPWFFGGGVAVWRVAGPWSNPAFATLGMPGEKKNSQALPCG